MRPGGGQSVRISILCPVVTWGGSEGLVRESEKRSQVLARNLRRKMTEVECILWSRLRREGLRARFRRQHPIGPYVADFACIAASLVVEVDGDMHGTDEARSHDSRRDEFMKSLGWMVLRIPARDVYRDIDRALEAIVRALFSSPVYGGGGSSRSDETEGDTSR